MALERREDDVDQAGVGELAGGGVEADLGSRRRPVPDRRQCAAWATASSITHAPSGTPSALRSTASMNRRGAAGRGPGAASGSAPRRPEAAVLEGDHRLVVEDELLSRIACSSSIAGRERSCMTSISSGRRMPAALAGVLRGVHREIGLEQQL